MQTSLIQILRDYGDVSEEDMDVLRRNFKYMSLKKKQYFDNKGVNYIIFVNKGILRAFTEDEDADKVVTRVIAWENRFINNFVKFKDFNQVNETIECIEDAEIVYIESDKFYKIISERINLNIVYFNILREYNELYIRRFVQYSKKSLEQKMMALKQDFPNLINRVSDSVLASFIGVSRESYVRGKRFL